MNLKLKPTECKDLPKIIEWENHPDNSSFIGSYSLERHRQVISDPNERHLKFVDQQNTMIGYAILAGFNHPHHFIELRRIVIAPKGKGYGRQAFKLLKKHCFEKTDCHRLWLDVYDFNKRARKLYRSEGFNEDGILEQPPNRLIIMSLIEKNYDRWAKL